MVICLLPPEEVPGCAALPAPMGQLTEVYRSREMRFPRRQRDTARAFLFYLHDIQAQLRAGRARNEVRKLTDSDVSSNLQRVFFGHLKGFGRRAPGGDVGDDVRFIQYGGVAAEAQAQGTFIQHAADDIQIDCDRIVLVVACGHLVGGTQGP